MFSVQLISREAIFYGTRDGSERASLIYWALPYAQRFFFKSYPDKYTTLKKIATERLPLLRTVGVDKLFYKYSIKVSSDTSNKRHECCSLLHVNSSLKVLIG